MPKSTISRFTEIGKCLVGSVSISILLMSVRKYTAAIIPKKNSPDAKLVWPNLFVYMPVLMIKTGLPLDPVNILNPGKIFPN